MHPWAAAYSFRRAGFYVRTLREQAYIDAIDDSCGSSIRSWAPEPMLAIGTHPGHAFAQIHHLTAHGLRQCQQWCVGRYRLRCGNVGGSNREILDRDQGGPKPKSGQSRIRVAPRGALARPAPKRLRVNKEPGTWPGFASQAEGELCSPCH